MENSTNNSMVRVVQIFVVEGGDKPTMTVTTRKTPASNNNSPLETMITNKISDDTKRKRKLALKGTCFTTYS